MLEPWHLDIEGFLDLKKNHGDEEQRARDLFYGLWIPDLFMKRVESQGEWLLCCPNECSGLSDLYGSDFDNEYLRYEKLHDEGKLFNSKKIPARELWFKILDSQMETGTPYMLYKDACNKKSNQKNIGTIKSSNLCTEIVEYSDDNESAVCNLASIALGKYVKDDKTFDYDKLIEVTRVVTKNLNKIIDINHYPTPKTERSNMRHRPIGIGVQGLADAFILMDIPFHSEEAKVVNKKYSKLFIMVLFANRVNNQNNMDHMRHSKILQLLTVYYSLIYGMMYILVLVAMIGQMLNK